MIKYKYRITENVFLKRFIFRRKGMMTWWSTYMVVRKQGILEREKDYGHMDTNL